MKQQQRMIQNKHNLTILFFYTQHNKMRNGNRKPFFITMKSTK